MKKEPTWTRCFANILFAVLISAVSGLSLAQTTTGSIYGTVTDTTGGVLPKTVVTVTNVQTGLTHTTESNGGGDYTFPALDPGDYSISARSAGFNVETQQGVRLSANQNVHVTFGLQPGSVNETVTVSAATTLVDTRESQLGETVDQRRIEDLPLNGRQVYDLVQILPGVTDYTQPPPNGNQAGVKFSVNGNHNNQNSFYLDGAANTAVFSTGGNLMPNPDALLEFRLLTSNFDAEYGRSPGGVVNAITRSGSNAFHGLLYEYLRNNVLNAKNYFSTGVTPLHQNQFGANFGGPIKTDRTFFFLSYQGLRIATPAQIFAGSQNTPTAAEIAGDFTGSVSTVKPHQPGSKVPFSCGGVDNVICPNLIDPVAKAALTYVPPASAVGTTRVSQAQTASANTSADQGLVRLDHQLTSNHQLSGTYFTSRGTSISPGTNNNGVYSFSGLAGYANQTNAIASDTWTISPNALNSLRLFYTLNHFIGSNIYSGHTLTDLGSQAGIGSAPPTQPQFVISGYFSMGMGSGGVDNLYQQAWGGEDTLNWTLGRHNLKLGGSYTWYKYRENGAYLGSGTATFSGGTTGNAFADFLLGRASSFRQNNGANHRLHEFAPALFAQDDFKISKKLTLNAGLRWEVFAPFVGENNFGTFSPGVQSKVFPTAPLGLLSVGDPGINDGIMHTNWKAFAPRVGFAYDVYGDGKTGLRGGYGLFYAARSVAQITNLEQQPYILDITLNSTPNLVTPYAPATDPFPYAASPKAPIFISGATVSGVPPNASFPYTQEFNLTLEQQLSTQLGLRVAYVGSVSRKYYIARDENSAVYSPSCPSASCSTTTANINSRRPYQPTPTTYTFGEISQNDPVGNASYHSLQATLTQRFSHGFSILASYVWAKSLDVSSVDPANTALTLSDENNPARDKGVSNFDVPNRFVASYLWSTPNIQHFGIVGRELLSGWQLNGITTISDGEPFNITSGADSNFDGTATTDRPNVVGIPSLPRNRSRRDKIAQYFNTAAFVPVPAGTPYGNASRNMLFAPGQFTTDFSAFKKFTLHKRGQLEFRGELYNLFNNVNLSAPVAVRTNAKFGQINGAGAPRIIQFALRYSF